MRWQLAGQSLVVQSPAKLNLFLEILGRRPDGYHELETVMVTVDWYDTLVFTLPDSAREANSGIGGAPDELRLECRTLLGAAASEEMAVPTDRTNLVLRAAELLRREAGISLGARIELQKRIPPAAGLAGGSGNAAATLWALNRLWNTGLSSAELQRLAAQLGSDIGFFLTSSHAAVCRGRGEQIEPISLPAGLHFVIARPRSGLSTAAVYRHCRPSVPSRDSGELVHALMAGRVDRVGALLHNALQAPAETLNEDVRHLSRLFSNQPVLGHKMSGSGTAWFGLCSHGEQARRTAARLKAAGVPYVAVVQSRL